MHRGSKIHPPQTTRNGLNERTSLEQRIAWLERQMVRLLWAAIGGLSLVIGGIAYSVTVGSFGGLGRLRHCYCRLGNFYRSPETQWAAPPITWLKTTGTTRTCSRYLLVKARKRAKAHPWGA